MRPLATDVPFTMHGATPHVLPEARIVFTQQSLLPRFSAAPDVEQSEPPHCEHPGSQHASPTRIPGTPSLHVGPGGELPTYGWGGRLLKVPPPREIGRCESSNPRVTHWPTPLNPPNHQAVMVATAWDLGYCLDSPSAVDGAGVENAAKGVGASVEDAAAKGVGAGVEKTDGAGVASVASESVASASVASASVSSAFSAGTAETAKPAA